MLDTTFHTNTEGVVVADVTHYTIHYMAESDQPWVADINCYDQAQGEAGGQRIAALRFFEGAVPASGSVDGVAVVNFPFARFADVAEILRNEQAIFVGHTFGGPDNITAEGLSSFTPTRLRP